MRQGSHSKRGRGRGGNRRSSGPPGRNHTFDSNGPDIRIRGNAHQVHEKYMNLAREASTNGEVVLAESYFQHAEHYYRILSAFTDDNNSETNKNKNQNNGSNHSGNGQNAAQTNTSSMMAEPTESEKQQEHNREVSADGVETIDEREINIEGADVGDKPTIALRSDQRVDTNIEPDSRLDEETNDERSRNQRYSRSRRRIKNNAAGDREESAETKDQTSFSSD
mgnify:CR=1 FL=1|tara:strand:- start:2515 stop:3183 length:669 start_codon:yes stop_codon:yes gene_type:complete